MKQCSWLKYVDYLPIFSKSDLSQSVTIQDCSIVLMKLLCQVCSLELNDKLSYWLNLQN